jgi:hypothetical protein
MTDKRRLRSLKQARRDVRRAKKRNAESAADGSLVGAIRRALTDRHPVRLLSLASLAINVGKDGPIHLPSGQDDSVNLDRVLTGLFAAHNRETTALLAVMAELLVNDPAQQLRCREELAKRKERLPGWIATLSQVTAYRAVRRSHVLGDLDEIVVGTRLRGGDELTVVVGIDHNLFSSIVTLGVASDSLDDVLAQVAELSCDADVVEMSLADARVWIENALGRPVFSPDADVWKLSRPLVRWLLGRLPEGGEGRPPASDLEFDEQLSDKFFASRSGAPFTESGHRELLMELFESGSGDPLRWSAARVHQALDDPYYDDYYRLPLEVVLDVPDLLRAFIPYAHVLSGIREGLTAQALGVIDELRSGYKKEILEQAQRMWGYEDAG